jgi:hypothetical protein
MKVFFAFTFVMFASFNARAAGDSILNSAAIRCGIEPFPCQTPPVPECQENPSGAACYCKMHPNDHRCWIH